MGIETIGRASRAMLAFLDVTSQGIGPDHIASTVQPTIDVLAFLGQDSLRVASNTAATGIGVVADVRVTTVPAGRLWVVRHIGTTLIFTNPPEAAHQSMSILGIDGAISLPPSPAGATINFASTVRYATTAAVISNTPVSLSQIFEQPITLLPGDSISGSYDQGVITGIGSLSVWALVNDLLA